ncbi:MAG: DUF554 domain-containing protein [Anaerolineaceae bacterium]|nr:DUF554 domain-containing protein [Anaerolineaceae bacterium]
MVGTLINVVTIISGGIIGTLIGNRLSPKIRQTVMAGLGIFTLGYGVMSFIKTENPLIPLGGLILGAILGEWWRIEEGLEILGTSIKRHTQSIFVLSSIHFVEGFVTASLLFCIGPMAILGSIQDGLTGDYSMLVIKAVMDGFASIAFASTLGIGVIFSAGMVLIYQGSISLLAGLISSGFSEQMIIEMSAVGGIILIGLAISSLLEIKKIRIGSFLPALILTPLLVWLLTILNVSY